MLDELERILGIGAFPVTWPLGDGPDFKGVYDRLAKKLHLYANQGKGASKAVEQVTGADDERIGKLLHPDYHREWLEQIELLSLAGEEFDDEKIRSGALTPVFFGSAINNFGVQLLLDYFIQHGMPPAPRKSNLGVIDPASQDFSAFVFKIQSNMDPNHRDSLSFIRVCSGVFEKDMTVPNPRGGSKPLRLSYPQRLFGQERETVEAAYPGDIVGLVSHGNFRIGDTLSNIPGLTYHEIRASRPKYSPICTTTPLQIQAIPRRPRTTHARRRHQSSISTMLSRKQPCSAR